MLFLFPLKKPELLRPCRWEGGGGHALVDKSTRIFNCTLPLVTLVIVLGAEQFAFTGIFFLQAAKLWARAETKTFLKAK